MCDSHRTHVTVVGGIPRCVLCGRQVFPAKIRILGWPQELWARRQARKAWWNDPTFHVDTFRY
jgi:hypothetical protein